MPRADTDQADAARFVGKKSVSLGIDADDSDCSSGELSLRRLANAQAVLARH